ncbi:MAG: Ig-like domain-containing protein [Pirellulales bacterium]
MPNVIVTASNDSFSISEDTATSIDPRTNDTDGDGNTKTIIDYTTPSSGSLSYTGDGTLTYTPTSNYNGTTSFQYLTIDSGVNATHFWGLNGNGTDTIGGTTATATNGPTTVTGHFGNAYSFDEVDDYLVASDFSYNNSFTISFNFKIDDNSGSLFQYIYSHGTVSTANSINIYLAEASHGSYANQLFTNIQDSNDAAYAQELNFDASSIINDGQWHTYTLSVQSGVGSKVYLDGVLKTSNARGGDSIDPTTSLYLGSRNDLNASRFYGGALDSVLVANRGLTSSEVTSLYSQVNRATASVTVTAVNDAPTMTSGYSYSLSSTTEDSNSTGTLASTILSSSSWADIDSSPSSGLAITGTTGNGTWQYSTDGTTWKNFGSVSSTNALLITSTTQVRYAPDAANAETATFSYRAWDQTSGTASTNSTANYASTSSNGGTTAFSTSLGTASISVSAVNDAPTNTLPGSGWTLSEDNSLALTGLSIADVDAASSSMSVTLSVSAGTMTATTGGGVTISGSGTSTLGLTGTVANINAYLAGASKPVFVSAADYNGPVLFTMTTSDNGNTGTGGTLTDTDTATITINAVTDATNDSSTTNEDNAVTISVLGNDTFANSGKTITAINGTSITAGGAGVSVTGGTVTLNGSGQLIFTPTSNYNGVPTFTYTVSTFGAGALNYNFHDGTPTGNSVANIPTTGGTTGVVNDFNVTTLSNTLTCSTDTFGVRYSGIINISTAGSYTFWTGSDDGSGLWIDGVQLVSNDGLHSFVENSAATTLTAGQQYRLKFDF